MSKTTGFTPRPYFSPSVEQEDEIYSQGDAPANQNPNAEDDSDSGHFGQGDTRNPTDTSGAQNDVFEKRYYDLKKHHDNTVSSLRREKMELEQKLETSANPPFTPPKTAEEIDAFRKQHPEFYDVMLSVAHNQAGSLVEGSSTRIAELEEKLATAEREKALKFIEQAHPDYVAVVNSPEFSAWLDKQTSVIQDWIRVNGTDHSSFIRALDLYKLDSGFATSASTPAASGATRNTFDANSSAAMEVSTKNNGVTVGDSNKRTWSRAEIERMTTEEFEKYEDEIFAAMQTGHIQ